MMMRRFMVMTVASDQTAQAQETVYGLHAVYFRLHEEQRQEIRIRPGRRRGRFIIYKSNSFAQSNLKVILSQAVGLSARLYVGNRCGLAISKQIIIHFLLVHLFVTAHFIWISIQHSVL